MNKTELIRQVKKICDSPFREDSIQLIMEGGDEAMYELVQAALIGLENHKAIKLNDISRCVLILFAAISAAHEAGLRTSQQINEQLNK